MKKLVAILSLCLLFTGVGWTQCTITQPSITNVASIGAGQITFDISFKHDRNSADKWLTIHMWKNTQYPDYNYNRVPTVTRLNNHVPFGTLVINNSTVSHNGSYTAAQAFASTYQNDNFPVMNTSGTTLTYNSSTRMYTIRGLKTTVPSGTVLITYDVWSSQSSNNQNVHCYNTGACLGLDLVLSVTGLETFKATRAGEDVLFSWSTYTETGNSHFLISELIDSQWVQRGMIVSRTENGNSALVTQYEYRLPVQRVRYASMGLICIVLLVSLLMRKLIPVRVTLLLCGIGMTFSYLSACSSAQKEIISKPSHWFKIEQIDLDGTVHQGPRMVETKF